MLIGSGNSHGVYLECVGKGVYRLTVYGTNPSRRDNTGAEVLMDDDDIAALQQDIYKAQRAKVTVT